jgi:hypothetical protein
MRKFFLILAFCQFLTFIFCFRLKESPATKKESKRIYNHLNCEYALNPDKLYGPSGEDYVWNAIRYDAEIGNRISSYDLFFITFVLFYRIFKRAFIGFFYACINSIS